MTLPDVESLTSPEIITRADPFSLPPVSPELSTWQIQAPRLATPWTQQVQPQQVLPEYPRPQMVRARWLNLNGLWQFAPGQENDALPFGPGLAESILVPFPVESALSGIGRHEERMWYCRTFAIPEDWAGQRVLLHFGAVDWETTVYVNGQRVGVHQGGYDAFSFDISDQLLPGLNILTVKVYDPTDAISLALGKQRLDPQGIWYTPCSGIWQTVWLEPVPEAHITQLRLTPNVDAAALDLTVIGAGTSAQTVEATVLYAGEIVAQLTGPVDSPLSISIPDPHLWSPDDPFLYDLHLALKDAERVIDEVDSYFGLRKISLGRVDGCLRILLNNRFVFQMGLLDQGYWPDGIYTAPTDEALRFDLEQAKALGYNLVRKHIKVEPARWYYWADRLGLLVWQDMPSMPESPEIPAEDRTQFELELQRLLAQLGNTPSIVMWVLFNENWGQYDTVRLTHFIEAQDCSRLVNNASGWNDAGVGDVIDQHTYVGPSAPHPESRRASVLGEFGGLGFRVPGHTWRPDTFVYEWERTDQALEKRYLSLVRRTGELMQNAGLSAAVYTQLTDVEGELNGWLTYDRVIMKIDRDALKAAHESLIAASLQLNCDQQPS